MNIRTFIRNSGFLAFSFLSACTTQYITVEEEPTDGGTVEDSMARDASGIERGKIRARTIEMAMGKNGVQAGLNYGLDEAAQTTIQIGITQPIDSQNVNGFPNLRAYIKWETSGVTVDRWVSVGGGTSVTGSSEAVAVQLQDFSGNPVDPDDTEYKVTVIAVPGSRGSTSAPPTLIPLVSEAVYDNPSVPPSTPLDGTYSIQPNQTVIVNVPPNVGVQSVYITPGTYQNVVGSTVADALIPVENLLVSQFDITGRPLKVYLVHVTDGFVPLSPQCTHVAISNAQGTSTELTGTVTFTNGSKAVTGSGTAFTTEVQVGEWIRLSSDPTSDYAQVAEVTDDTHIVLASNYAGTSAGGDGILIDTFAIIQNASLTWGIDG